MNWNYRFFKVLIITVTLSSLNRVQAQLYAGPGGTIYISQGDSIYINENMDVTSGATITDHSSAGITLTGVAILNGLMEYNAMGNQNILPYNHDNLYIAGTGNKTLTSNINVRGELQLGGTAKIVTNNNILSLTGNISFLTGVAPFGTVANSWIVTGNGSNGLGNTGLGALKISSIGATGRTGPILFPVGPSTSSYNPVTVTNSGTTDDFAISVKDQPVPGAPLAEAVNATWDISEGTPGGSDVSLGMQWNTNNEAVSFIRSICGIVHSNGTTIDYFSKAGPASGTNPYTQSGIGFTSFSPFGITSNASVLPVDFLMVRAYPKGALIQVDWDVAGERSISHYEVQKSNTGNVFKIAGKVAATGNYSLRQSYSWPDLHPNAGSNFYRIRSVGLDGSYKYSQIVNVNIAANASSIRIYPNPVINKKMVLEFRNKTAGNYLIRVISNSGALVYQKEMEYNGMDPYYLIQLPAATSKGIYQVIIVDSNFSNTILKMMIND
ncbi:MAG: T9SS type A sorting domain-containing protein [Ferruginibacter sp.]